MQVPHRGRLQAWIAAACALGGLALAKLPLLMVLLAATLISIVLAEFEEARFQ
jgi:hypothetical protein